jgi:hypothetical protein
MIETTAESYSTNQTNPKTLALITFLAEFDERWLLMISAERADNLFPL